MDFSEADPDRELLPRAVAGDAEAFEALARRWWARIGRYAAAAAAGDALLAEEVAQDALLRLYMSLPRFRGEASFGTFVYRVCRNAAADAIRRQRRERRREAPLPQEEPPGSYRGPEAEAVRASERQLVLRTLQLLDEDSRSILYLKEAEDMSINELGRIFGLAEGTVKSRLSRIRAKLRALLEEAGYGLE
jgi:RNA polymerase sigma-70 factor (ECF subfamily)